ncbi:MAG TPA: hypothetical protein VG322_13415 [Candidatus Acidoferrales bacterium]|jgi:hypothetical protein|nr:hypothetical protein [Candidatus Acidoferrales bacterium]
MGALYVSHYLWVIFAFQVIAGVLLLVNRYVPLAVAVLAPVVVNILTFHASMAPSGLPLDLFVAVLWARSSSTCDRPFTDYSSRACSRGPDRRRKEKNMTQELTVVTRSTGKQGARRKPELCKPELIDTRIVVLFLDVDKRYKPIWFSAIS